MGRKVKKKISGGLVVLIAVAVVAVGAFVTYEILNYRYNHRPDMQDYYSAHADVVDDIVSAIRTKAASENIKGLIVYNNYASANYTYNTCKVAVRYAVGDELYDVSKSYSEFFDKATAKLFTKLFYNSTAVMVKLSRDMTTNTYRIDFIELKDSKRNNLEFVLSYISKPFADEQAARDYYGVIKERGVQLCYQIFSKLSDNYYYVIDTLENTEYRAYTEDTDA